ncbi:T-cell receptor beta chain [Podarcis lilfordi]|nr:T-cell receptor beta chain [Podarcis lilfordi]
MWRLVLGVSVGLQLLTGLCSGINVIQEDRFQIIREGSKTIIDCKHDDSSYLYVFWYRQKSNSVQKQLQLIGFSIHGNDPEMEMTQYSIDRPEVTRASLSIPRGQAEDTAVYFCAASKGTARVLCVTAAHEHRSSAHTPT